MQKFFVEVSPPAAGQFILSGENFDHIRVLRLKCGDEIVICDGLGNDFFCSISELSRENAVINVERSAPSTGEPDISCSVYVGLPKAEKLEHIIQKSTEMGAAEIIAFLCERCVSRPDEKALAKKLPRWQKIAESAASQCGRGLIPRVRYLPDCDAAFTEAAKADMPLFLYENEEHTSLKAALSAKDFGSVSIVTGPEGGFSHGEVDLAAASGLISCSIGLRILRCETAPLCTLAAVMYHSGNL